MTFPGGFCHSERVPTFFVILNEFLGEEESLPLKVRDKVVKLMADFIYDSSNEHARFFTAFRMTFPGGFCHSERVPPFFVILKELLAEEESLLLVNRSTQDSSLSLRMTWQSCFFLEIQPTLLPKLYLTSQYLHLHSG